MSGARVLLKPAAPGTGLIAGGVVRTVLEVAGVRNVLSKSLGSSNKINCTYATMEAMRLMQHPDKWHTAQFKTKKKSSKTEEPVAKTAEKNTKTKEAKK